MNNKFFKICMLSALAMAANACDTGEYNDLDCDNTYVSECLTTDHYMFCNGNKLEVAACSNGQICIQTDAGHQCAPAVEDGCTASSCNGNVLKQCNNGISTDIDCSLSGQICNPSTLACETPTEKCTASSCAPDGVTLNQCDTATGQTTPINCGNSNQVCGTDESGNAACVDATPEPCTETVCDADTNVLKVCNIPEGASEGTVEERDCAAESLVCGTDEEGKPACVAAAPETCTADACSEDGNILKHCKIEGEATEGVVEEEDCTKDADGNDTGKVCGTDEEGNVACVDAPAETCTADACGEDGKILKHCKIEGDATEGVVEEEDCSKDADGNDTGKVCGTDEEGKVACVAAPVVETCTADACSEDGNILKHCKIEGDATEGVVEEEDCTKDADGNDTGKVCGTDEEGKIACVDAVETCTESVCDGNTLKFCNIPEGASEGTVELKDCTADNDMICGKNAEEKDACIAKCVAADTKCDETTQTLTVCDETTGILTTTVCSDSNQVCGVVENDAPACVAPAPNTCTANVCDEEGKLVVCTIAAGATVGTPEEAVACQDNKVCGLDADNIYNCIEPCDPANNSCEGEVFKQCNEETHLVEDVDCAAQDPKMVCEVIDNVAGCVDACTASEPACSEDNRSIVSCGEDGHEVVVTCDADKVCGLNDQDQIDCIDKCAPANDACSDDLLTLSKCNEETGLVEKIVCRQDGENLTKLSYCDATAKACVEPTDVASVVGLPCTCEGEDCNVVITGAEFKAIFNTSTKMNELLAGVQDTDNIIGPNFYATGNKGCESLEAVSGMSAACYRNATVTIPASIRNFLTVNLANYFDEDENASDGDKQLAAALRYLANGDATHEPIFSSSDDTVVKFIAPATGYCMYDALDIGMEVSNQLLGLLLNQTNLDALTDKFNTGDHETAKNATCPEGSVLYTYELAKNFTGVGNNTVNFDLCLQECSEATDCREGFQCMKLQEVGLKNYTVNKETDERPMVCFSNDAHQYFIDMKAKLAVIKSMLPKL